MKKTLYLVMGLVAALPVFNACNDQLFLTEEPKTVYTKENAFEKSTQIDAALVRAYIKFNGMNTLNNDWVGGGDPASNFLKGDGAALLGGDTTASPDRICINVAVLGECPSETARLRSTARPGDLICVTGCLGDSAGGLKAILEGVERDADVQALIDRHYLPLPRVEEGLRLAATPGVHAMMDISDGIGSDLKHILEASGVGAVIDVPALPLSPALQRICARLGWDAAALATGGGEDYELLFTCTPEAEKVLDEEHFGLKKIKDRIIQQIAVMNLNRKQYGTKNNDFGQITTISGKKLRIRANNYCDHHNYSCNQEVPPWPG